MSNQISRAFVPAFSRALGTPVEIVLKPGGNGAPAAVEVARSKPDGSTLFMGTLTTQALAPHFSADLPYDPLRDFAPVSLVSHSPLILGCNPSLGVNSVSELVALAH